MNRADRRRALKPKPATGAHCHFLIKETAVSMAHELYDTLMHDNDWYAMWKKRVEASTGEPPTPKYAEERWVGLAWPELIPQARAALAAMLAPGASMIDEAQKAVIHEALVLDHTLLHGRVTPTTVIGATRH